MRGKSTKDFLSCLLVGLAVVCGGLSGGAFGQEGVTTQEAAASAPGMSAIGAVEASHWERLQLGMQAYMQGDFSQANEHFKAARSHLDGKIAQEMDVKIATTHLLAGEADLARSLLESFRDKYAGDVGGRLANASLKRLAVYDGMTPEEQNSLLKAEHLLSMGDVNRVASIYTTMTETAQSDEVREYAHCQCVLLEADGLIMTDKLTELSQTLRSGLSGISRDRALETILSAAEAGYGRIDGTVDKALSEIQFIEDFVTDWFAAGTEDDSLMAEYYLALGTLNLHRLTYTAPNNSGKDPTQYLAPALDNLEMALSLSADIPHIHQEALLDLVDVYLASSRRTDANKVVTQLIGAYGENPLLPLALMKMAIVNSNWGNYEESVMWLLKLKSLFPQSIEAQHADSLLQEVSQKAPHAAAKEEIGHLAGEILDEIEVAAMDAADNDVPAADERPVTGEEISRADEPETESPAGRAEPPSGGRWLWVAFLVIGAALVVAVIVRTVANRKEGR